MDLDRNGLEVLDRDECYELLASVPVGRIGLSIQALPVILPVNFVIDGDEIIIRSPQGAKADAALRGSVVAIEADGFDGLAHEGWSVLVRGRSRVVEDPAEIDRLGRLWVTSWGTPHSDRWIAVSMEIVTGRRIRHDLGAGPDGDESAGPSVDGTAPPTASAATGSVEVDLSWETWAMVRANHHTTAASLRTFAAPAPPARALVSDRSGTPEEDRG